MTPWLEIILCVRGSADGLAAATAALAGQTELDFGVVLGEDATPAAAGAAALAALRLSSAGVVVRRCVVPFAMDRVAQLNWTCAQAAAEWLLPLRAGDVPRPDLTRRLRERVGLRPSAQLVLGGTGLAADTVVADMVAARLPSASAWFGGGARFAVRRPAWRAVGGCAVHFPATAEAHAALMLALHHGFDNLPGPLVDPAPDRSGRVARAFEWWLAARQARLFCHNARLAWPPLAVPRTVARRFLFPA